MELHHIGLNVNDIDSMSKFYVEIFNMKISAVRTVKDISTQIGNTIYFLNNGNFVLELLHLNNADSFINKMHFAITGIESMPLINKLNMNNIKYDMFYKENYQFDYMRIYDPENNIVEVYCIN